jgi:hypothetical protein
MSSIGLVVAGRYALLALTSMVILVAPSIAPALASGNQATSSDDRAQQPAQPGRPQEDRPSTQGGAAADSSGHPPAPPTAAEDDRELVKKRMKLCRQRPELCVQNGDGREAAPQRPGGTPRDP